MRMVEEEEEEGPDCLETEAWQDELETRGLRHIPVSVVSAAFRSQRERFSFNNSSNIFTPVTFTERVLDMNVL